MTDYMFYVEADPSPWETIYGTHCTDYTGMRTLTDELFVAQEIAERHAIPTGASDDYEWRELNHARALLEAPASDADRIHAEIRTLEVE